MLCNCLQVGARFYAYFLQANAGAIPGRYGCVDFRICSPQYVLTPVLRNTGQGFSGVCQFFDQRLSANAVPQGDPYTGAGSWRIFLQ